MERRDALRITGSVLVGAGALYGARRVLSRYPGPVTSVEFYGVGHDFENHAVEFPAPPDKEPVIDVDREANEVTVDGLHYYGSSECDTSEFGGLEYDEGDDTVRAVVRSRPKYTSYLKLGCTADLAGTRYRLVVSFERLPTRFVVEERNENMDTNVGTVEIDPVG